MLRARRDRALATARDGVVFGTHFVTFRGLAERCAAETEAPVCGVLAEPAVARVVAHCAAGLELERAIEAQPRVADALASSLRDLRDAGIPADAVPGELGELYRRTERALAEIAREEGLYDRVGLFRLATRGAASWARRLGLERALVHGASDLAGTVGDLLDALGRVARLRVCQPDPGHEHAARIRERWPWSFDVEPLPPAPNPVYRPGAEPRAGAFRILEPGGGPAEELESVCRAVLAHLEEGAAPSEIAVVARSLEPYAAWIPVVFASYGIPFESSLGTPALLFPEARSLLQLSRALLADLERESVVELVASRLFRWRDGEASRLPDLAERLARRAGIVHGTESWRRALDRAEDLLREERTWIAPEERERIRRIVEALAREAEKARSARGFGEAVRVVLDAADRWLAVPAETASPGALALDSARAALDSAIPLDVVDRRLARRSGATAEEVLGAFERALRDASVHPYEDSEGVRVLDAVQARALPFRHLLLVGFNDDAWPRPIEEDPFLPDPLRLRLREGLRRPIPLRGEWESDERLLLFLLLSQATETLTLSYRTVDAAGRPSGPSCYLRELPVPEARAAPAHLVPLRDALVEAPLAEGTAALRALAAHAPRELSASLERGLSYLSIVEDFDSADLRFDGGVGRSAPLPERWSASHLEELGHCPLRAFFGRTLRVPRPEERSATEPERRDVGQMVHGALQRLYEELWKSGRLRDGAPLDEAIRMARELLPEIVGTELASASPGSETGTLGLALRDRTAGALLEFVAADLERLLSEGLEELVCEHEFEQPVVVSGAPIVLHGKIDRLVRLRGGRLRISDYKSGAEPVEAVARAEIERGRSLQLPLYVVATASERDAPEIEAEALHTPLRPERTAWRGAEREHPLRLGSPSEVREAVRPALETLVGLVRDGRFPFRRSDRCRWCAYTVSCRREHFASAQRVSLAEPFRPYFELQERET